MRHYRYDIRASGCYVGNDPVNYTDPTGESRFRGTLDSSQVDAALETLADEAVDEVANRTENGSIANSAAKHYQRNSETLRQARGVSGKKSHDSSKNEKHGDKNAVSKVQGQFDALKAKAADAKGTERKKIEQKIKNIEETARKNQKGEEHGRRERR